MGREALPLNGQHPVALEVPERAVVGDDLEAVAQRLEAAAGAMAAVGSLADQVGEQLHPLSFESWATSRGSLLADAGRLEQQRREQLILVAVDVQQPHRRAFLDAVIEVEAPAPSARPPRARWR